MREYDRSALTGDLIAGSVVAIMLVPQGMAYALLAGLPAQVGLYASLAPLVIYALLGTSRTLSVGPVAMVSLLVAAGASGLATPGSPEYVGLALALALLVGAIQVGLGLLGAGFLVNFVSHPVMSGFTSAAAIVIALSQVKHLLGIDLPHLERVPELLAGLVRAIGGTNPFTLGIGAASLVALALGGRLVSAQPSRPARSRRALALGRAAPLLVVLGTTLAVGLLGLGVAAGVDTVGAIPGGLPALGLPPLDPRALASLLPTALVISFVGFMESFAVGQSLASKRREKVEGSRELVALGAANLAAAVTAGYPVTGGFSRSVVNFSAGARTRMASVFTAVLVALTLLFLTPLFLNLPKAALAAIIVVAVAKLVDFRSVRHLWRYNRADAVSLIITFVAVLLLGIEAGILAGVGVAIALHLWRTSRPHMAVVGRVGRTEHFRNVLRHDVHTCPRVLAVRVDESLYFANTRYLENQLLAAVADQPEVRHLVLICSAVNFIDGSALETLEELVERLRDAGVTLHLAEVKGPVMDRLARVGFAATLAPGRVYLSTHDAVTDLECPGPEVSDVGVAHGVDAPPSAEARGARTVPAREEGLLPS